MSSYVETGRILCQNNSGKTYVVIEQIKTTRFRNADAAQRLDYMTDDGEIVNKLDDNTFLLLLSDEVIHRA